MKVLSQILLETIPLFLFLVFILYSNDFILMSNTILGKVVAFILTVFYFSQDILYGILFGLIVVFYYQTDLVSKICTANTATHKKIGNENFATFSNNFEDKDAAILPEKNFSSVGVGGGNVIAASSSIHAENRIPIIPESAKVFKSEHCSPELDFVYKEQIVKHPETIRNIYPEIAFIQGQCNPCSPDCEFSLKTSLEKEDRMGKGTRGYTPETFITKVMNWANSFLVNKSEPYVGLNDLNNASYYS